MKHQILKREGCPTHYWLTKSAGKPVVVFTHGVMMDHRIFDKQVAEFEQKYNILVWDVRGHGLSRPMEGKFSIRSAAEDLIAILDESGFEKAILVGHSMGGYISQEVVFSYPNRVAGLVMIGSTCLTWKQPWIFKLGNFVVPAFFRTCPDYFIRWLTKTAAGIKAETRRVASEASKVISRKDRICFWTQIMKGFHYEPDYSINHPILLTHGEFDHMVGLGVINRFARAWSDREQNCRYTVIPKAGHNAHEDNPAFFNEILEEFLQSYL